MNGQRIVAGGSAAGLLAVIVVYLSGRIGGHLSQDDGAIIAATAIAFGAFFVHNGGLAGLWRLILHGQTSPPPPPEGPPGG